MPAKIKYVAYPRIPLEREEEAYIKSLIKEREDIKSLSEMLKVLAFNGNPNVAMDNKVLKEQLVNCLHIINQVPTLDNNIKYQAWLEAVEDMNKVVSEVLNKIED